MVESGLFEKILVKEDLVTEFFFGLLRYPKFNKLFANFLSKTLEINHLVPEAWQTQYITGKYGNFDAYYADNEKTIIIENKIFNAPLTKNQPMSYIRFLERQFFSKRYLLFFVCGFYHSIKKLEDELAKYAGDVQCHILYWEDFAVSLRNSDLHKNAIINEFSIFLDDFLAYNNTTIPFEEIKEMHDSSVLNTIISLYLQTDDTARFFQGEFHVQLKSEEYGIYGFYLNDIKTGKERLWVGFWPQIAKEYKTDLIVAWNKNWAKKPKTAMKSWKTNSGDIWLFAPLEVEGLDPKQVAEKIKKRFLN